MRQRIVDTIRDFFRFGRVAATTVGASKSTLANIESDDGEASKSNDEMWGHAPLLYRPVAPDDAGACEALFYQLGEEKVVLATMDRRWQIEVAEGEVIVRAMGSASPAYVHLKPDGTAVIASSAVCIGAEAGTHKQALADVLKTVLSALTVPTAMGPSGTPINVADFDSFVSTKHKIDG